jgi:hypothetical protein
VSIQCKNSLVNAKAAVTRSVRYAGKQSIRAMFVERSPTRKFEKILMLTLQIKATSERQPGLKNWQFLSPDYLVERWQHGSIISRASKF